MSPYTVHAALGSAFWRHLDRTSVSPTERASIELPRRFDPWTPWLAMEAWTSALETVTALTNDTVIGARIGTSLQSSDLGAVGRLILSQATADEALSRWIRFENERAAGQKLQLAVEETRTLFRWIDPSWTENSAVELCAVSALLTFVRVLIPKLEPSAMCINLRLLGRDALTACKSVLSCPVETRADVTALSVDTTALQALLPPQPRDACTLECYVTDDLVEPESPHPAFKLMVYRSIARRLGTTDLTLGSVSRDLGVSTRTLHRRLTEIGCSYSAMLEKVRTRLATRFLSDPAWSIGELSALLGYSELSAFSRAYRRSAGQTAVGVRAEFRTRHPKG